MAVEVAVVGSPSLIIVLMVSVDVKQHRTFSLTELRSCAKAEVAVLGSSSLTIVLMVSVDVTQHWT